MTPFARAILHSPASRAATYTAPDGGATVPCRILLNDTPGETRREAGEEFLFDGAEGTVADAVPVEYEGRFMVEGSEYSVSAIHPSKAPGLIDLGLIRISGAGVDLFDLSRQVMSAGTKEVVELDGRRVEAVVARRADTLEADEEGYETVVQRNRVGIAEKDLGASGVRSRLLLDGELLHVTALRPTAAGLVTLIC